MSQFSALASLVFMMAFTAAFDGFVWRHRFQQRRISVLLRQYCSQPAAW